MFMRYFRDEILKRNTPAVTMLSRQPALIESRIKSLHLSRILSHLLTMRVCEVEILITPTKDLVRPSEKFNRQTFSAGF